MYSETDTAPGTNGYPIPDPNPKYFSIPDPYPINFQNHRVLEKTCLLYTSDAADE